MTTVKHVFAAGVMTFHFLFSTILILFFVFMKKYRPLLLEELPITLPGLKFRCLRLNRHLPDIEKLAEHRHSFGQVLLYLNGRGLVRSGTEVHSISPGAVLWIPPGVAHGFDEQSGRRPLCLVLEFRWAGPAPARITLARLPGQSVSRVRHHISTLARQVEPESAGCRLGSAISILCLMDLIFPVLGLLPPRKPGFSPLHQRVQKVLKKTGGLEMSVAEVAEAVGLSKEHLSRTLRQSTGHTLRDLRDQARLAVAVKSLEAGKSVGEAACDAAILDQNYFARWFKKLTGCRPSQWNSARGK